MRAKKSLGQNFLRSEGIVEKVVDAGHIEKGDVVLEIGPGTGAITEKLLQEGAKVVAVETDQELIDSLAIDLKDYVAKKKLILIKEDILNFDPGEYAELSGGYKVISNIPYYITGEILERFLSAEHQPSEMILLVQKEVAERIVATDGKESILSISVKIYSDPSYVQTVKAGSFVPAPKVDSAIIHLENISKERLRNVSEKIFFEVVKAGFAHKRKKLFSNLKKVFDIDVEKLIQELGFDKNVRAEDLSLNDWLRIIEVSE